jgi:hypothetical protein
MKTDMRSTRKKAHEYRLESCKGKTAMGLANTLKKSAVCNVRAVDLFRVKPKTRNVGNV